VIYEFAKWFEKFMFPKQIRVPISAGELLDKMIILEIKLHRISDPHKWKNIRNEWEQLNKIVRRVERSLDRTKPLDWNYLVLTNALRGANRSLWETEDRLRELEASGVAAKLEGSLTGDEKEFVMLAREVYHTNDERSKYKRDLNQMFGSALVEEKSYKEYKK
jgi:hypothetical protein